MIVTQYQQLLNGGSKSMAVNGSVTPVTFSYSPGSGVVQLRRLSILLKDEGNTAFTNFGALSALANGLLIRYNIGGNNYTVATIKDNATIANVFCEHQHFGNGGVLSILSIVTPQGFGNTNNVFKGTVTFENPVLLTDTDAVQVVVQDNLSGLDILEIGVLIEISI